MSESDEMLMLGVRDGNLGHLGTLFDRYHPEQTNLVHPDAAKNDYIITADLDTRASGNDWKWSTTIVLGFACMNGRCTEEYKWLGSDKSYQVRPKLIDMDSDSIQEVLIQEDDSGNQSTHEFMTLWKYIDGRFEKVFKQGVSRRVCYPATTNRPDISSRGCFLRNTARKVGSESFAQ